MPRYIILDTLSGDIVADTLDLDGPPREETPLAAVQRYDAITRDDARAYAEEHPSAALNGGPGYIVYLAPDGLPKVREGEDRDAVNAVTDQCEAVAFVEVREL